MTRSATLTGIAIIIFGIWLSLEILASEETPVFIQIYPAIIIVIGVTIILFRKEENKIEERKDAQTKKQSKK